MTPTETRVTAERWLLAVQAAARNGTDAEYEYQKLLRGLPLSREEELAIKHGGSDYKRWDSGEVSHVDDAFKEE